MPGAGKFLKSLSHSTAVYYDALTEALGMARPLSLGGDRPACTQPTHKTLQFMTDNTTANSNTSLCTGIHCL